MGGVIAARNVEKIDHLYYHNRDEDCFGNKQQIHGMHWPWGAGMFATSLGPHDACFVVGANWNPNSGYTVIYGSISAVQMSSLSTLRWMNAHLASLDELSGILCTIPRSTSG